MEITREIFWNIGNVRILIYLLGLVPILVLAYGLWKRIKLWRLGKKDNRYDRVLQRIKSTLNYAVLQIRTLEKAYPGTTHSLIFWGFVILFLGTLIIAFQEDVTLPFFSYNFFHGYFYLWYSLVLDLFGLLGIAGILFDLYRRIFLRPESLDNKAEDFFVLYWFLLVLFTGYVVEALRIAATKPYFERWSFAGWQVASWISLLNLSTDSLKALHRVNWWVHAFLSFGFIGYLAYSKLLHIFSSPLSIYFRTFDPIGMIKPIPDLENRETFGVSKLEEFTWKDLLDADACTKCGRCQDNCPAWQSSKPLSPKKVILDMKAHLNERVHNYSARRK